MNIFFDQAFVFHGIVPCVALLYVLFITGHTAEFPQSQRPTAKRELLILNF